jgi:transcription elongation factor Elf1
LEREIEKERNKEGEIKKETFSCSICGCRYESDEYELFEEIYDFDKRLKVKTIIKIIDECPKCKSKVYKKI